MKDFIPVNTPLLSGKEKEYLTECIDSGWISSEGPFVKRFEEEFASRMGRKHGIAVCNGTAALDVSVEALNIGPGDEVILPAFTIISCVNQIVRSGAKPVLVDCDPATWNMRTDQVESRVSPRTRAIMVVHIYGLPVDMDPILEIAQRHGLPIIEDAAEAQGQFYRERPCGNFGAVSTFSFYPNKHVTTGEGGMILTDDDHLAESCRSLRDLCFRAEKRFVHERLGWNYRMTNLQAAIGVAQLERLEESAARKRFIGTSYMDHLRDIPGIQLPLAETEFAENIFWVFGIVLEDSVGFDAAEAIRRLAKKGIGCRPFFFPIHQQPVLLSMGLFSGESYPVAESIAQRGFYIPSGLAITKEQIDQVSDAIRELLK